jgi:hypothetical protein
MVSTTKHTNVTGSAPSPRRSVSELPDQAAVDAAGIALDLEAARLVSCVIFRQITRGRSKTRGTLYHTEMGLAFLGRQEIERNGDTEPAPFPDLPLDRWPQGKEVLSHLGITHRDLEAYCRGARQRAEDACLPLEWALAFFPAPIWPMIAKLIEWGPEQVALRMEWAVTTMAQTTTQRNRRRRAAGEPLSDTVIDHYIGGVWQLMDVLLELRSIATNSPVLPLKMLDAWTTKPARITARAFGARSADIDNSGPSLDACSQRLKWLHAEARVTSQGDGYLKRRRALLMALVCLYGPRADAFRMVRIEDYLPTHRYPDGTVGPVLRIYPGKTWDPDEAHYLPLPDEVARWVEEWVTFTGRRFDQLDEPLFPNRKPKPDRPGKFFTTHGFYTAIAGARQKGSTGSYAMLPRGDDPFIGFHPHAFRHTAVQLAVRAASNLQRADPSFYPHVTPQEFGKAIVGHELITDVSATYSDLNRQLLCRAVVDEMWRLLWDDGVLRRGPAPDRVRGAREQRDALRLTVDALHVTILELDTKAEQANRRNGGRDAQRRLERQLQAAQYQLEAHARRDDLTRFQESLDLAEEEFSEAQAALVPIPEHVTDAEHARRLADALGQPAQAMAPTPGLALPDEVPLKDVATLFGTTPQAIGRWRAHGFPKHRPLPWLGGEDAWHDVTQKDRRLGRDAINMAALTPDQERLLEQILIRLALEDGRTNPAASPDGQLDAWETSGSSPPSQPNDQKASE